MNVKMIRLFQKKKKKTVRTKIVKTGTIVFLVLVVGYFSYKGFEISKIFAETSTSQTVGSDLDFNKGNFVSTEISESGEDAYLKLEGGSGPDDTIYVRPIQIDNTQNSSTLEEYQIFIDNFDTASLISAGKLQDDCDDLRFTNENGDSLSYSIVGGTCNSSDTEIWVKIDSISASSNTNISMYYGNPVANVGQDEAATFSYSQEKTVAYLMDSSISSLKVITLEDGNSITHNGSTLNLQNEMDIGQFNSLSNFSPISAKKLFEAKNTTASDMMVPISWAGTEFILSNRSSNYDFNLSMLAPWENATVQIYVDGSVCGGERTVTSSGLNVSECGISSYDVIRVVSTNDVPFLLNKTSSSGHDPMPIHPADMGPWYGFDSSQYLIKSGPNGADYRWIDSNDNSETNPTNLGGNTYVDISAGGDSYYGGETVRTRSVDYPIGVQTYADADGGDSTTHMLRRDFGKKFGSPFSTDFVAIVSDQQATCSVFNSSGAIYQTRSLESSNNLVYGLAGTDFGRRNSNTFLSGKWKLECDKPVMVVSQYTDDEQNMFSYPMMRQFTYPTPSISLGTERYALPSSGTWESDDSGNAIDLIWNGGWGDGSNGSSTAFSATVGNVGANSSVTFQIRTAATTSALSEESYSTIGIANSGTEFIATKSQLDALGLATGAEGRYVQVKATLSSSDGITNPQLDDFTIYYQKDSDGPETNASGIQMKTTASGELVGDSDWTKADAPYFSWNAASDSQSDLKGYCLYLGTDNNADPATAKGILGTSPISTTGTDCQFIVSANNIDFANTTYRDNPWLSSSSDPYYFKVKAIDNQDNVYDLGEAASFSFKYDGTPPTNPGGVSAPQSFQNSLEAFIIYWPTSGAAGPSDSDSGVKGYQYKIGSNGDWMGANHAGDGNCDDVITQGTYVLDDNFDTIVPGENTFYLRTLDNACNISSTSVSAILKYSGDAPSEPVNLAVDPSSSDENSFAFSWDAPITYSGQESGISYCYTVNSTPSSVNCIWTYSTSLEAGAFATQPGENTFYVVAKDEAGNINYDAYSSIDFTANTSAPGIARSIDVSDISIKATSNWKLAVSWEEPENVGSGVEDYKVYRSTSASSCSNSFSSFDLLGTTAGTSYTDTSLDQKTYYYCVKACDSANNCSAFSGTASNYPDGKFIEPAELTSDPSVSGITTKRATISWSTGRTSDSKVAYGKGSSDFYDEEPSNSEQVTDHKIALTNLDPGTQYYYKVKWTDEDGNTGESKTRSFETDDAPSISSVNASSVGIENAFIDFTVKDASAAQVVYGESTSYGGTVSLSTSTDESTYSTRLSGLKDGTVYHYKIILKDSEEEEYEFEDHTFTTLPRPRVTNVRVQQVKNAAQPTVLVSWDTNTEISSIVTYYPESDPGSSRDEVDVKLKKGTHQMLIKSLNAQTPYLLIVKGRDKIGNEAVSDTQKFTTASDTRPPQISDLSIESSSIQKVKEGQASTSQLVVSWNTDEASTSQIEFGEGTGNTYSQRTQEDGNLTYNHLVVISGLTPSKVYHLRVVSKDESGNASRSIDTVTITPKATDNALDLVVGNLRDIFGFLK